jgi:hypothetical protein
MKRVPAKFNKPPATLPSLAKPSFHPRPNPPPWRGREILLYFDICSLSPGERGQGEGDLGEPPEKTFGVDFRPQT